MRSRRFRPAASDRRGVALVLVLFAVVIVGALLSGAFVVGRFSRGATTNTALANDAANAADAGLAMAYAHWDPTVQGALPVAPAGGAEWASGPRPVAGTTNQVYLETVRRLNGNLFLVQSTGRRLDASGAVLAELTAAQFFRLVKPTIGVNAAITVQDPLTLNGNAYSISGFNSLPPDWGPAECPALDPGNSDDVVGIRSAVGTGVMPADWDNVVGFPARDAPNDPTITSDTFRNFLDLSYSTLAAEPGVKVLAATTPYTGIGPVATGATTPASCDRASPLNLGEPARQPALGAAVPECYGYFPVVRGTGTVTRFATDSRGQGTLLIDGDLEVNGRFTWVGLVIVKGRLKISGNRNRIVGAVLAEGLHYSTGATINGNVEIDYSQCAIERAVGGATVARPLGQRSWLHLY
jgi:hypothetical protein